MTNNSFGLRQGRVEYIKIGSKLVYFQSTLFYSPSHTLSLPPQSKHALHLLNLLEMIIHYNRTYFYIESYIQTKI